MKLFADPAPKVPSVDHESENRRLKRDLARVTEERDILSKGEPWCASGSRTMANAYFVRESQ
jgi:transposase